MGGCPSQFMRRARRPQTGGSNRTPQVYPVAPLIATKPQAVTHPALPTVERRKQPFTSRGTPRLTKDERNGTVVRTRANWDVMRKDAGVYRQVRKYLPKRHLHTDMPWWEAEEQQRLLEAARHAAVDQPPDARPTAQVPPTPAPQKTVPPAMTADEVAQFLCYRITDDQKDVSRAFKFYDKDGGGTIDRKEFRHFLEDRYLLRLNDYEFHKFYKFVDTDGTGVVDFREFLAFFNRK